MLQTLVQRLPRRTSFEAQRTQRVRDLAASLARLSPSELLSVANDLRDDCSANGASRTTTEHGCALALEALRRTIGLELFDVQIKAAFALADNNVVEMETGEGKTLAAVPAAMLGALRGQAVHVVTPNAYLAERDFTHLRPAFELLGISLGLLPERVAGAQKQAAYDCEVVYGTGYEFGFDYLRDQLSHRSESRNFLGADLLDRLQGGSPDVRRLQRGQLLAIVDEVDNVLIDDAISPLILSDTGHASAEDRDACLLARKLVGDLRAGKHYLVSSHEMIELTELGLRRIHEPDIPIPMTQLRRPWGEYVQQALRADILFRRDVHYVVESGELRIVDGSTGRIFSDRAWSDGLHQAIEAKERLEITNERQALAQISRQRYFRLYESLAGMTGTADGCQREFQSVYRLPVTVIRRRLACCRRLEATRGFATAEQKWAAISREVCQLHRAGRPVLVGTRCIADSERLAGLLRQLRLSYQLLNGRQDAAEAEVVAVAGRQGAITIATNLAGRGTDIRLDEKARQLGGLHVIVSEPHELSRVDRQLIGRSARQGDPGSARTFVSAEDSLLTAYGPWLRRPLQRCADSDGEAPVELTSRIVRIQAAVERQQAARRMALMRRDLARESLLSRIDA